MNKSIIRVDLTVRNKKSIRAKEFSLEERKEKNDYFRGMYIELLDAPIPGRPCLTGLFVIAYSPR